MDHVPPPTEHDPSSTDLLSPHRATWGERREQMRDPSETLGGSSIKAMRVAAVEVQVETEEERLAGGKMGFPGSRIAACSRVGVSVADRAGEEHKIAGGTAGGGGGGAGRGAGGRGAAAAEAGRVETGRGRGRGRERGGGGKGEGGGVVGAGGRTPFHSGSVGPRRCRLHRLPHHVNLYVHRCSG